MTGYRSRHHLLIISFARFYLFFVEDPIGLIFAPIRLSRFHRLAHRIVVEGIFDLLDRGVVLHSRIFVAFPIAFYVSLFIFTHQAIVGLEVIEIHFDVGVADDLNIFDIFMLALLIRFLPQLIEVDLRIEIHLRLLV